MGVMEGRDNHHIQGKFGDIYGQALLANWKVWPLAQVRLNIITLITPDQSIADKFPIHAITLSCAFSGHMRSILDILPVLAEFKV